MFAFATLAIVVYLITDSAQRDHYRKLDDEIKELERDLDALMNFRRAELRIRIATQIERLKMREERP